MIKTLFFLTTTFFSINSFALSGIYCAHSLVDLNSSLSKGEVEIEVKTGEFSTSTYKLQVKSVSAPSVLEQNGLCVTVNGDKIEE